MKIYRFIFNYIKGTLFEEPKPYTECEKYLFEEAKPYTAYDKISIFAPNKEWAWKLFLGQTKFGIPKETDYNCYQTKEFYIFGPKIDPKWSTDPMDYWHEFISDGTLSIYSNELKGKPVEMFTEE